MGSLAHNNAEKKILGCNSKGRWAISLQTARSKRHERPDAAPSPRASPSMQNELEGEVEGRRSKRRRLAEDEEPRDEQATGNMEMNEEPINPRNFVCAPLESATGQQKTIDILQRDLETAKSTTY